MIKEIRLSAHCFIIRKCRNIWWLLICKMFGWIQISDLISDQNGWERKIKAKVECSVIGLCDGYWNCTLMEVYASSNRLSLHFDSWIIFGTVTSVESARCGTFFITELIQFDHIRLTVNCAALVSNLCGCQCFSTPCSDSRMVGVFVWWILLYFKLHWIGENHPLL